MGATSQEQNSPFSFEILSRTNEKTSGGTRNANLQLRAILRHKLGQGSLSSLDTSLGGQSGG